MRTLFVPARLLAYVWSVLISLLALTVQSQNLYESVSYSVHPACFNPYDNKYATVDRYFLKVDINSIEGTEEDFSILLDGSSLVQFHVSSLPHTQVIGPFKHSGTGTDFIEITLQSLNSGYSDDIFVSEVVCGYATSNGINQPGYFCDGLIPGVIAQSAPAQATNNRLPDQLNIYVLKDEQERVVGKNYTGLFDGLVDFNNYSLHAFAVSMGEHEGFFSEIIVGQPLMINHNLQCYALCGIFDLVTRCDGFDLALEKDILNGPMFHIGDTVEYNITITNEGEFTAYDVVIADMIPEGLKFISALNNSWTEDAHSLPIDSIAAGGTHMIPIKLIIEIATLNVEIVNTAEIFYAGDQPGSLTPAFDTDSTPNNEEKDEDDIDDASISILELLCPLTFDMNGVTHDPICDNTPIQLSPIIMMATRPVSYSWWFDGVEISTDSIIRIENPTESDYGLYELTITDANTCSESIGVMIESITTKSPSCIGSINMSIAEDCSLKLYPDMLTLNDIPGIDDFILEVRDGTGNLLDLNNLLGITDNGPLVVKMINPCTGQTVCWGNINLEYKLPPKFDFYSDTLYTNCMLVDATTTSGVITSYNESIPALRVLEENEFSELVIENTCLIGWNITHTDLKLSSDEGICSDKVYARIYSAVNGNRIVPLDTAILVIENIEVDSLQFPSDLSNLTCSQSTGPSENSSAPYYIYHGDTIRLNYTMSNEAGSKSCSLLITYSDQIIGPECAYGAKKILRQWTAVDWCDNQYVTDNQYIYIMDLEAPRFVLKADTIDIWLEGLACQGDIDLEGLIELSDNCDPDPIISIEGYAYAGYFIKGVQSGIHHMTLTAHDRCDNSATQQVVVRVRESELPVPVALSSVAFTYGDNSSNWIYANSFDNGSHDSGCGAVSISIARLKELEQIEANGTLAVFEMKDLCDEGFAQLDLNENGELTRGEMFRDKILICCEDIDQNIEIVLRVTDQSGNTAEVTVMLHVTSKAAAVSCDDGNPCTYDDVTRDGCPCVGKEDIKDLDQDGVPDCQDTEFIFCKDNLTLSLKREEIENAIINGALPGRCEDQLQLALISGSTYTRTGDMIEKVRIQNNYIDEFMTSVEGDYAFPDNEMYKRYELMPSKNDDSLNGVTALDLILIQQHLLGISSIDNPYNRIAADINRDGKISASDIAELRKLLLGQITQFQSNNSWRFVPVQQGINENDPYDFTEEIIIGSLDGDYIDEDWIGIKIGDVSDDAKANSDTKANVRSNAAIKLYTMDQEVHSGQELSIPIYRNDTRTIKAIQLGLHNEDLEIVGVESGFLDVGPADFAIYYDIRGFNVVSEANTLFSQEGPLFSIIAKSKYNGRLSEKFSFEGGYTVDIAYSDDQKGHDIELQFADRVSSQLVSYDKLYQNTPNPFIDETTIRFELSETEEALFQFYTANGVMIYEIKAVFPQGVNELKVNISDLGMVQGLVYYQMETKEFKSTRSMVINMK
jgi:uncharacterized repeat protein (TIGR01451 family)